MFCASCGTDIAGDKFCRKCGHSSSSIVAEPNVTIGNVYRGKNVQMFGSFVLIVGFMVLVGSCGTSNSIDSGRLLAFGLLTIAAGLAMIMYGKFQHWYHAE